MINKYLINTILIIGLVFIQLSFISSLPGYFNGLNLIIVALVFLLVLEGLNPSFYYIMVAGLIYDFFSFQLFGTHLLSFLLSLILINFLLINFFTDRSLYSFLALTFFAIIGQEIFLNLIEYASRFLLSSDYYNILTWQYYKLLVGKLAVNLILSLLLFYFMSFASAKLKPVFLRSNRF